MLGAAETGSPPTKEEPREFIPESSTGFVDVATKNCQEKAVLTSVSGVLGADLGFPEPWKPGNAWEWG